MRRQSCVLPSCFDRCLHCSSSCRQACLNLISYRLGSTGISLLAGSRSTVGWLAPCVCCNTRRCTNVPSLMNMAVMVDLMMKCGYVMTLGQCLWPQMHAHGAPVEPPSDDELWVGENEHDDAPTDNVNDNSFRPTSTEVPRSRRFAKAFVFLWMCLCLHGAVI
jgi:hypothetical protein